MVPSGPKRLSGPRGMFSDNLTCLEWMLDRFWKSDFLTPKSIFGLSKPYSPKNVFWASFQNLTCPSVLNFSAKKARGVKNMTKSKDLSSGFLIWGIFLKIFDFLHPLKPKSSIFKPKCLPLKLKKLKKFPKKMNFFNFLKMLPKCS